MRKFSLTIIILGFLYFSVVPFQNVLGQTENKSQDGVNEEKRWLMGDLRLADVGAYVDVKDVIIADRTGKETDCENNTKGGYCLYLLKADVKEIFKGKVETKTLDFYTSAEATYPKKNLSGEKIVFLVWNENKQSKKTSLGTIENSTRGINALDAMRKMVNPRSPINETDESEPYSSKAIKNDYEKADAVVYANVTSFEPDKDAESGSFPFVLKGKVKKVFKGSFKDGKNIAFKEELSYRPIKSGDLGEQIIFLEKVEGENGKIWYRRIGYTVSEIRHDVLEKLRKIGAEKSKRKN